MNNFLVNLEDGTINVHYDGLNPSQVHDLIRMLDGNVKMLESRVQKPLDIFRKSARLNRLLNELCFQFSWSGPVYRVDLDSDINEAPIPTDVILTVEEHREYLETFQAMIA